MTTRTTTSRLTAALSASGLCLALAACGAEVEDDAGASTTTVQRCGEEVEYRVPERAVVYEGGSADKLFALGLGERVAGYVMPPANPPVSESPWAEDYERTELLSQDLLNREVVVDARADLVVAGWRSGFSEERGITPEILDRLGISSFMHAETCYGYPGAPERVAPLEGLYTDLERLGQIFGVENRAEEVVAGLRERVTAATADVPDDERPAVFVYDSGTAKPFTAGAQVPPTDMIRLAGGRNVFADLDERWTEVGWESVVDAAPEVVIIVDYGDQPAAEKIEFLRTSPLTSRLPAVVQDRFFVLDYNEAISSPRNVDGLEKLAAYLEELRAAG